MNVIVKITSKAKGGGKKIADYLDERTKRGEHPDTLNIIGAGSLSSFGKGDLEKEFISREKEIRDKRKITHIRIVFSFSSDYRKALETLHVDADKAARYIASETLFNLYDKFFSEKWRGEGMLPGNIQFIMGTHKDTDNLHAHVALLSETTAGRYISIRSDLYDDINNMAAPYHYLRLRGQEIGNQVLDKPPAIITDTIKAKETMGRMLKEPYTKSIKQSISECLSIDTSGIGGQLAFARKMEPLRDYMAMYLDPSLADDSEDTGGIDGSMGSKLTARLSKASGEGVVQVRQQQQKVKGKGLSEEQGIKERGESV